MECLKPATECPYLNCTVSEIWQVAGRVCPVPCTCVLRHHRGDHH